jgi:CRP/FNR family transcriptional regulator
MKNSKSGCDLATCSMCRICLKEWNPAIASTKKNFLLRKGEVLFKEGDRVAGIYFVYRGSMKVHKNWGDEKELIIRFAKSGDIVGHRGIGNDKNYPISATALETTEVCFIDLPFFNATLKVNNEYLFQLLLFFADELRESEKRMRDLAHMPVKGRVKQALMRLMHKFGINENGLLNISISKQDLSSYVGAAYETVFKILNELSYESAISMSGKGIMILDKTKLLG